MCSYQTLGLFIQKAYVWGSSFDILKHTAESAPREKLLSTGARSHRYDVPHPQEEAVSCSKDKGLCRQQHKVNLVVTLTHLYLALLTRSENEENQSCLRAFSHLISTHCGVEQLSRQGAHGGSLFQMQPSLLWIPLTFYRLLFLHLPNNAATQLLPVS